MSSQSGSSRNGEFSWVAEFSELGAIEVGEAGLDRPSAMGAEIDLSQVAVPISASSLEEGNFSTGPVEIVELDAVGHRGAAPILTPITPKGNESRRRSPGLFAAGVGVLAVCSLTIAAFGFRLDTGSLETESAGPLQTASTYSQSDQSVGDSEQSVSSKADELKDEPSTSNLSADEPDAIGSGSAEALDVMQAETTVRATQSPDVDAKPASTTSSSGSSRSSRTPTTVMTSTTPRSVANTANRTATSTRQRRLSPATSARSQPATSRRFRLPTAVQVTAGALEAKQVTTATERSTTRRATSRRATTESTTIRRSTTEKSTTERSTAFPSTTRRSTAKPSITQPDVARRSTTKRTSTSAQLRRETTRQETTRRETTRQETTTTRAVKNELVELEPGRVLQIGLEPPLDRPGYRAAILATDVGELDLLAVDRVTDPEGEAAAGIGVDVFTADSTGLREEFVASTETDSDGNYRIEVPSGDGDDDDCYVMVFVAPDGIGFDSSGQFREVQLCGPFTNDDLPIVLTATSEGSGIDSRSVVLTGGPIYLRGSVSSVSEAAKLKWRYQTALGGNVQLEYQVLDGQPGNVTSKAKRKDQDRIFFKRRGQEMFEADTARPTETLDRVTTDLASLLNRYSGARLQIIVGSDDDLGEMVAEDMLIDRVHEVARILIDEGVDVDRLEASYTPDRLSGRRLYGEAMSNQIEFVVLWN